jgi:hypothetical protein
LDGNRCLVVCVTTIAYTYVATGKYRRHSKPIVKKRNHVLAGSTWAESRAPGKEREPASCNGDGNLFIYAPASPFGKMKKTAMTSDVESVVV